jgi:hypothetical protein
VTNTEAASIVAILHGAYPGTYFDGAVAEVSDMLHMSGECLCGAFAKPNEIVEIAFFFPEMAHHLLELEDEVRAAGHPFPRCTWGWGGWKGSSTDAPPSSGPLCSSCDARFDESVSSVTVTGGPK